MDIPRQVREELNALSKEVFGSASKWRKILDEGTKELTTFSKIEKVPGVDGAPDTEKEVKTPVLTASGVKQWHQKYYTLDEVRELLVGAKTQLDAYRAAVKKHQEDQEKKRQEEELLKNVQGHLGGSAL